MRVLSRVFRGKFIRMLKQACDRGELGVSRRADRTWPEPAEFERLLDQAVRHDWVVYAKRPFGGPEQVLEVPGPLHPSRGHLQSSPAALDDGQVTFRWKDYAHGAEQRR